MDRELTKRATDQVAELLDEVGEDRSAPTPCADWDLERLVDHVVAGPGNFLAMAEGQTPDWGAPAQASGRPGEVFRDGVRRLNELDALPVPPGMFVTEMGVHAYDLARALGRDVGDLDPEVAEAALAFMKGNLTDENRGTAFGAPVPAPEGASAYERMAAYAGRQV